MLRTLLSPSLFLYLLLSVCLSLLGAGRFAVALLLAHSHEIQTNGKVKFENNRKTFYSRFAKRQLQQQQQKQQQEVTTITIMQLK